jgi:hypothetical protein
MTNATNDVGKMKVIDARCKRKSGDASLKKFKQEKKTERDDERAKNLAEEKHVVKGRPIWSPLSIEFTKEELSIQQ